MEKYDFKHDSVESEGRLQSNKIGFSNFETPGSPRLNKEWSLG